MKRFITTVCYLLSGGVRVAYAGNKAAAIGWAKDLVAEAEKDPYGSRRICVTDTQTGKEVFRREVRNA